MIHVASPLDEATEKLITVVIGCAIAVEGKVLIEIKAVDRLAPIHFA